MFRGKDMRDVCEQVFDSVIVWFSDSVLCSNGVSCVCAGVKDGVLLIPIYGGECKCQ